MTLHYSLIPVTPFAQNCSILWCSATKQAAIVDAGGDSAKIIAAITQRGLTVEKLLLTHGHIDHVGAALELKDYYRVEIEGPHPADAFWLDQLPLQSQYFNFPLSQAFSPKRWLDDGDRVTIGECTLDVFHCPGHTPGHIVYYHSATALLIAGDVLFQGSIGRTDFPMGNHQDLLDSIRHKLFILPDDTTVLPGHGALTTLGVEKRSNPFLR